MKQKTTKDFFKIKKKKKGCKGNWKKKEEFKK